MSQSHKIHLFLVITAVCIFAAPRHSLAAQIHFVVPAEESSSVGGTNVKVLVDPEGSTLNVVEGTIKFESGTGSAISASVTTDTSILNIWPVSPVFNPSDNSIRFTGGVPKGFSDEGLLFEMKILSTTADTVGISMVDANGYLNDGKGTLVPIRTFPIVAYTSSTDTPVLENGSVEKTTNRPPIKNIRMAVLVIIIGLACLYGYIKHKK